MSHPRTFPKLFNKKRRGRFNLPGMIGISSQCSLVNLTLEKFFKSLRKVAMEVKTVSGAAFPARFLS